jgi:hypothetical protein
MAKDNNQEFAKILRDQLYEETCCASVSEYLPERVQLLVKLIEGEEKTDESEVTASYDNFIARFGALEQTLEQEKKRRKQKFAPLRFAKGAVAAIALILVANITTYAVMDTSIFHIVKTAVNQ